MCNWRIANGQICFMNSSHYHYFLTRYRSRSSKRAIQEGGEIPIIYPLPQAPENRKRPPVFTILVVLLSICAHLLDLHFNTFRFCILEIGCYISVFFYK